MDARVKTSIAEKKMKQINILIKLPSHMLPRIVWGENCYEVRYRVFDGEWRNWHTIERETMCDWPRTMDLEILIDRAPTDGWVETDLAKLGKTSWLTQQEDRERGRGAQKKNWHVLFNSLLFRGSLWRAKHNMFPFITFFASKLTQLSYKMLKGERNGKGFSLQEAALLELWTMQIAAATELIWVL